MQVGDGNSTPNGIEVALHYYYSAIPHPRVYASAVREAIRQLLHHNLMYPDPEAGSGYMFTEKGKAWIDLVCATPFPVCDWSDPRGKRRPPETNGDCQFHFYP